MNASSKEIEREVEATRANVENTVQALRERLSVGEIVDETTRYLRENCGAEVMTRFGEQLRANPLPLALVGVGLAWLMSGRGHPHLGHDDGRHRYPVPVPANVDTPEYAYRTHGAAGALSGEASDGESAPYGDDGRSEAGLFSETAASVRERVSEIGAAASSAAEWAEDSVGRAGHYGRDIYDRAGDATGDVYRRTSHYARDAYSSAQRGFFDLLEREPLVIGALGVAVGAAIGAMLPRTEIEDRYLGEASRRVKDDATSMARGQFERGKAVAQEAHAAARGEADAQGLTS
jgi:hypothetical protein